MNPIDSSNLLSGLLYAFSCPLEIVPPHIVVAYGGSLSVQCRALTTDLEKINVETPYGKRTVGNGSVIWSWENVTNYDNYIQCFINLREQDRQCYGEIQVTVYSKSRSDACRNDGTQPPVVCIRSFLGRH